MKSLLVFGLIQNIISLAFRNQNNINYYSIVLLSMQGIILTIQFAKGQWIQIISTYIILICCFFNGLIIQTPLAYFTFGCSVIMAKNLYPHTQILSLIGVIVISWSIDVYYILETISFILIHSFFICYNKIETPKLQIPKEPLTPKTLMRSTSNIVEDRVIEQKAEFDLFKKLLSAFPDGVVIMNDKYISEFGNSNFKALFGSNIIETCCKKLLNLRNAIDGTQNNYQQLFILLDKKIKSNKYSQHEQQSIYRQLRSAVEHEEDMMQLDQIPSEDKLYDNLSLADTLQDQVIQIFKQIQERDQKDQLKSMDIISITQQNIKFFEEIGIICQNDQKLFHVILKPYKSSQKAYIMFIIRDITHINQIATLEQMNLNKSQMLSNVAHEFRTPLGIIQQFSKKLVEVYQTEPGIIREYINPIQSMVSSLLGLVSDLLDVSQLKAGKFNLNFVHFRIDDLLQEVVDVMNIQAVAKNIYVKLNFQNDVQKMIKSDPGRIKQIILNLISNGIKFTKVGGILVSASQHQDMIEIKVQDTGVGIPIQEQDKLFTAFGKIESTYNPTGVGLGLMISNILAQKLGDKLTLYSEGEGKGATFTFSIKNQEEYDSNGSCCGNFEEDIIERKVPAFKLQYNLIESSRICDCVQILVVDDIPFNIVAIEKQLQTRDIRIDKAYSASEALAKIERYKGCINHPTYRVVLLDLEMPVINGYQACRMIRDRIDTQIIACSAHSRQEIDLQTFDGYIEKPLKINEICNYL